jgi:SpoVK/Ycf46/Vps4 family AAA+-type ATPase
MAKSYSIIGDNPKKNLSNNSSNKSEFEYEVKDSKNPKLGNDMVSKEDENSYTIYKPEWKLDEIILSSKVKDTLEDVVSFCKDKDRIVEEWNLKRFLKGNGGTVGINFYGPPGTGKSIAAEGVAHAIGRELIRADYSEISDSLLGGTEKKLTALFKKAEEHRAVIFFDEADGLLGKRTSGTKTSETNNQIKSHLLTLLDRSNAIIVFATNLFENYDRAFFRRILFHVGFESPTYEQRIDLWKFHLNEKVPLTIRYEKLAELSDGLAGGDIKNLTLKLCIKLSASRIKAIDEETVKVEITKYKDSLKASENNKNMWEPGRVVDENSLKNELKSN